ncbi:MAG: hypothetical protein LBG27_11595 [Spirochaetaceae bacterium]|jgi:hypothetical protein|nr:hypothetical protein [Spirochaetaceae bacterium]
MKRVIFPFLLFLYSVIAVIALNAADFVDGNIKLTLNDRTGRFSLFYLSDAERGKYQSLLWSRDAKTSYLAVQLGTRVYKLGDTNYFRTSIRGSQSNPSLVFESPRLSVVMDFSFIKTPNATATNGIRIDIRMQNWGESDINAGMKLVLDTYFGEKKSPQFQTNLRYIDSETIINRTVSDQWWLTKDKNGSLMGSIFVDGTYYPDTLHFGNWKRLADARWKATYVAGRNFNALPFSIKDDAVAYFMETTTLVRWDQRTMTVMLATEDQAGFAAPTIPIANIYGPDPGTAPADPLAPMPSTITAVPGAAMPNIIIQNAPPAAPAPAPPQKPSAILPIGSLRVDLLTLRELIYKIDEYVYFGTGLTEEELRGMEMLIARLRSRYGSVFGGYY